MSPEFGLSGERSAQADTNAQGAEQTADGAQKTTEKTHCSLLAVRVMEIGNAASADVAAAVTLRHSACVFGEW